MRRPGITLVLAIGFAHVSALAQTSTRDGVQALLRGDDRAALQILRPLAEETVPPDPIAQFFLAMLYDSAPTLAPNPFRACRLYASAAEREHPLRNQAAALAHQFVMRTSEAARPFCQPLTPAESRGVPAATFTIGPGHAIAIDRDGFTVRYRGAQKHTPMTAGGFDSIYLPIEFRNVSVTRPAVLQRHFVEVFAWTPTVPGADPQTWALGWTLYEVAGLEVSFVARVPVLTQVTGAQPPTTLDTAGWATVRTSSDGEAEWVLPAQRQRGILPPLGSR